MLSFLTDSDELLNYSSGGKGSGGGPGGTGGAGSGNQGGSGGKRTLFVVPHLLQSPRRARTDRVFLENRDFEATKLPRWWHIVISQREAGLRSCLGERIEVIQVVEDRPSASEWLLRDLKNGSLFD